MLFDFGKNIRQVMHDPNGRGTGPAPSNGGSGKNTGGTMSSLLDNKPKDTNKNPNNTSGSGYPYGYGGGWGSGGSSGPTPEQEKAAGQLGALVGYNQDTILGAADNAKKTFDNADKGNQNLLNAKTIMDKRTLSSDWFPRYQKLQSSFTALRDQMGSALNGSNLYALLDATSNQLDMDTQEVLNSEMEAMNANNVDYFQALQSNINSRNESALDTEQNLRELGADYVAQLQNMHPDLAEKYIKENKKSGGTLNLPEWLKTNYFDENFVEAATPDIQGLFRPDAAGQEAWSKGLRPTSWNNSSSTNQTYQERLRQGYTRRVH